MKKRAAPPRSVGPQRDKPISRALRESPYRDKPGSKGSGRDEYLRSVSSGDEDFVPDKLRRYMDKRHPGKSKGVSDDKLDDYLLDFDRQMQKALGRFYHSLSKEVLQFYRTKYKEYRDSGKYSPSELEQIKNNLFEYLKTFNDVQKKQNKLSNNVEELIQELEDAQLSYDKMKLEYETRPLYETGLTFEDLEEAEDKILQIQKEIDRIQDRQRAEASKQQQKLDALKQDAEAADAVKQEATKPPEQQTKALTDDTTALIQGMLNASKLLLKYIPNDPDVENQLALYAEDFRSAGNEIYQVAKVYKRNPQVYSSTIAFGSVVAYPWAALTLAMKENDGEVKTADWRDLLTDLRNKIAPSKDVKQVRTDASNYVRAMKQRDKEIVTALSHVPTSGKGTQEIRSAVSTYATALENLSGFARRSESEYPSMAEAMKAFVQIGERHLVIFKKVLQ